MKKIRFFLCAILTVFLTLCAFGCAEKAETTPEELTDVPVTFLTYNMRYNGDSGTLSASSRMPRIIERINEYSPDVIGGQEVQPVHITALKRALEDEYTIVYRYREAIGFSNLSPESCPILFKTDKFELLDSGHFWLSETPDVESKMTGAGHYRICTWVRLREYESDKEFYYYNTHLDFGEAQTKSLPVLLSRLQQDATVVLGGDMNIDPTEPNYATLCASLTDSRVTVGTDMTIGTYHDYGPPEDRIGRHIDFLFYRGSILPTVHKVVCDDEEKWGQGNFASDHYPVYVRFLLL